MIITRTPLRISIGGGGTDLPSYYSRSGGFVISAAIDRHIYITLHRTFKPTYIIKYSELETVEKREQIKHPIIREAFAIHDGDDCTMRDLFSARNGLCDDLRDFVGSHGCIDGGTGARAA